MEITSYLLGKKAGGGTTPTGTIDITENGTTNVTNYATANVNVQPTLQNKSVPITTNGSTSVSADENYDGLGTVSITTNVQPNLESKSITITENTTTTISPTQGKDGLSSVEVTTNVSGGIVQEKDVNFYDYDGTLLYSYSKSDFAELTELPDNPTRTGLTAQGWNWTLADAKSHITEQKRLNIGQLYTTSDGKTRLYVDIDETTLELGLKLDVVPNVFYYVAWGDGGTSNQSSGSGSLRMTHTYANPGSYVIEIYGTGSNEYEIKSESTAYSQLINKNTSTTDNENQYYSSLIKKIELGDNVKLGDYALMKCSGLETITIPNRDIFSSSYINCFGQCRALKHINLNSYCTEIQENMFVSNSVMKTISLPKQIITIGKLAFSNCYGINITMPEGMTTLGQQAFYNDYCIQNIEIPSTLTSIGTQCFNNLYVLSGDIIFPSGITTIGNNTFSGCSRVRGFVFEGDITSVGGGSFSACNCCIKFDFTNCTTVPTLSNYSAFNNCASGYQIVVPDSLYSTWTTTSPWNNTNVVNHIVKESEV